MSHHDAAVRDAIATVNAWLQDERDLGLALASGAMDDDPIGFLDALAGLWTVVHDVAAEVEVDVTSIVRDIALGVAQAELEGPS
jgi:hypothetical protein